MRIKINNDEEQLNGIFNFTFSRFSSSQYVYDNIVTVSASSTLSGRGNPKIVINPYADKDEVDENWISESEENSSITISFIRHVFAIDSYTLQSRNNITYNSPLEVVLEGTKDNHKWTVLDHKPKENELVGSKVLYHAKCFHNEFFQSFRFTMIGENYHKFDEENYCFALGQIEFFGSLFEIKCTLPHYEFLHLFRFIYLPTFLFTHSN